MKHIKWDFSLGWAKAEGPRPNQTFSEYGHVAYQIQAYNVCSNMVANILPTYTPLTQGLVSKGQTIFFLKVVMLHIKLKGIEHRAP